MKALWRSVLLAAVILAAFAQQASAQSPLLALLDVLLAKRPILLGTTGACNSSPNANAGDPCTQASTLVLLNAQTGALIKTIGPVGYTVNGLAWDRTSFKLYASTALGCGPGSAVCPFHGLITINPFTGKGTPVDPKVKNFGLAVGPLGEESPVHSIAIDSFGNMVGWYDEFPPPDTYVRINQRTGVATEFPGTGINTNANGVAFGQFNLLWNINSPQCNGTNCGPGGADLTQTAYILNPFTGKKFASVPVTPPTMAALGDFLPGTNRYYGLKFDGIDPTGTTLIEMVDLDPVLGTGTVATLGPTVNFLHTLAFIP
jgi:hypothetical protein